MLSVNVVCFILFYFILYADRLPQFCGVLRVQARSPRPPSIHHLLRSLSFTATSSRAFLPYAHRLQPTPSQLIHTRHLSLASVFGPRKPTPTPAPAIVARIATLEADANAHPESLYKQLALFDALVASGVKPAYDVVIARWERTCEFVRHPSTCSGWRAAERVCPGPGKPVITIGQGI